MSGHRGNGPSSRTPPRVGPAAARRRWGAGLGAGAVALGLLGAFSAAGGGDRSLSFELDVLPLLQRQGCASAYCHGSATGRGGFKLSLFGSDPRADWLAIAHDLGGRRIDLADPDRSLLLRKPSLRVRHGGGRRLPRRGAAYAVLREWIARGAPWAEGAPPVPRHLEVVQHDQRVGVRVALSNGEVRDVTHLAVLSSTDEDVARIDHRGRLVLGEPGEAWVLARYAGHTARLRIVRPFEEGARPKAPPAAHPLDRVWLAGLAELGLRPGPRASPTTLARRLYVLLLGRPPLPHELRAFLELPAGERVAATARALVRRVEFTETFARRLAEWFELTDREADNAPTRQRKARLRARIHERLAAGGSLRELARDLLLGTPEFVRSSPDPRDRAELVARTMLGIRIGCARCHDHPLDRWRRRDHLAFSAFFADPRPTPDGAMTQGRLFDPATGEPVTPRLLALGAPAQANGGDLLATAARFVLEGDHRRFERNLANRIFAYLLGRGLVEPLDDHRTSNPPVFPELLEALTDALVERGDDLRAFAIHVVSSRMFATDSVPAAARETRRARAERRFLARRTSRAMPAWTLRRAVASVLGMPASRAPLPRSPLARQLALLNGDVLHRALETPGNEVDLALALDGGPRALLEDLFVRILSRPPRPEEIAAFLPELSGDDRRGAAIDLAFALLSSREFGVIR